MATEYRITWTREFYYDGKSYTTKKRSQIFQRYKAVLRKRNLLGPTPWKGLGKDPDGTICCNEAAEDCLCENPLGTFRERTKKMNVPPLKDLHIEQREVGKWAKVDDLK